MIIYISGPMTNRKHTYKKLFHEAAKKIESKGHVAILPFSDDEKPDWTDSGQIFYMLRAVKTISRCDAIYLMNEWDRSDGCTVEKALAVKFKKKIFCAREFERIPYAEK